MDYHLMDNGQNLGVFPLTELRRRRVAGELTGWEVVWCEGMDQWQPLDSVLQTKLPGAFPPGRTALTKPKVPPALMVLAGGMLLIFLCGLVLLGLVVVKRAGRIRRNLTLFNQVRVEGQNEESPLALAAKPVLWSSNTVTAAQVMARGREFRLRQYVEGYQLRGERGTDCDELCLPLDETRTRGPAEAGQHHQHL
jgi:hypothetical protein